MPTEPQQRMAAHTSIELRQAAAGTNLMTSIIGDWAKGHGFDEDWEMASRLEEIAGGGVVDEDVIADDLRRAAEALRRNVIGTKIALCHSELSEALESLRDTGVANILTEGNFGEELADVEIRVKNLANLLGIDLGQIEIDKIATNAKRPYKHGRHM